MNTKKNKKCCKKTQYEIKENTKYFLKNRLPAFILAGFMIFWTIASILGIVAYSRSDRTAKSNIIKASAQTKDEYDAGELIIDLPIFDGIFMGYLTDDVSLMNVEKYSLVLPYIGAGIPNYDTNYVQVGNSSFIPDVEEDNLNVESVRFFNTFTEIFESVDFSVLWDLSKSTCTPADDLYRDWSNIAVNYNVGYYSGGLFFVTYIYFTQYLYGNAPNFPIIDTIEETVCLNINFNISKADDSYFIIPYYSTEKQFLNAEIHKDDLAYGFNSSAYLDKSAKYQLLYDSYNSAFTNGYSQGRVVGRQEGYNEGYDDGVKATAKYTFDGLISSVLDVPVRTFTSLFNFEILGVNLASFFFALLTLAVVLCVIKLLI